MTNGNKTSLVNYDLIVLHLAAAGIATVRSQGTRVSGGGCSLMSRYSVDSMFADLPACERRA